MFPTLIRVAPYPPTPAGSERFAVSIGSASHIVQRRGSGVYSLRSFVREEDFGEAVALPASVVHEQRSYLRAYLEAHGMKGEEIFHCVLPGLVLAIPEMDATKLGLTAQYIGADAIEVLEGWRTWECGAGVYQHWLQNHRFLREGEFVREHYRVYNGDTVLCVRAKITNKNGKAVR